MSRQHYEFVAAVGRAYMFGDSEEVKDFKTIVEHIYTRGSGRFDLTAACFGNIWILNGWTLVIASDIQMFCANKLQLEPLAKVRRMGGADVNFNINIVKEVQPQLPI